MKGRRKMKELKELENKINEMKKRIEELEEENGKLEYNLFIYDTERKEKIIQKFNIHEKAFIEFIEEYQNDNCISDEELCQNNLIADMVVDFLEAIEDSIDINNIKKYFNYERYN
jgi:predicted nuclease with TOPRIM domain